MNIQLIMALIAILPKMLPLIREILALFQQLPKEDQEAVLHALVSK